MKAILLFLRNFFSKVNKYYLTGAIFLVITFFIGDSTLLRRYEYDKQINELENEINEYEQQIKKNEQQLEALKSDNESLEHFAREKYFMTNPNEDLFIIK